jgi:hypothetical protein
VRAEIREVNIDKWLCGAVGMEITKKACAREYHLSRDETWKDVAHGVGTPTLAKAVLGLGLRRYWSGITRELPSAA